MASIFPITLTDETKERISRILDASRVALHYGWIPLVLYIGWSQSVPRPNAMKLLSPLPSA